MREKKSRFNRSGFFFNKREQPIFGNLPNVAQTNLIAKYSLGLLVITGIMFYALWRRHRLTHDIRFTVATTIGRRSTPRNPNQIAYEFTINRKIYYGTGSSNPNNPGEFFHGRYYIRVPLKSPGASQVLWEKPVADSVIAVAEGWAQIPR